MGGREPAKVVWRERPHCRLASAMVVRFMATDRAFAKSKRTPAPRPNRRGVAHRVGLLRSTSELASSGSRSSNPHESFQVRAAGQPFGGLR
ncbi:DUF2274 domain-containing protein [Bradyrhizobium oligotrophicum]|uniref:DUF2274 domain-containing protein n=1 Tax=Bradyrhizobium oligotrophicum TaxID=44255 RepID=UPI0036086231